MFRITLVRVQLDYFKGIEDELRKLGLKPHSDSRPSNRSGAGFVAISLVDKNFWLTRDAVSELWDPFISLEAVAPLLILPDAKSQITYLIEEGYVDKDSKLAVDTLEYEPSPYLR